MNCSEGFVFSCIGTTSEGNTRCCCTLERPKLVLVGAGLLGRWKPCWVCRCYVVVPMLCLSPFQRHTWNGEVEENHTITTLVYTHIDRKLCIIIPSSINQSRSLIMKSVIPYLMSTVLWWVCGIQIVFRGSFIATPLSIATIVPQLVELGHRRS